jgi:hypothetical protein
MSKMDGEKERQRLTALYANMEDGELNRVAADLDSLTDVAREVLRNEMLKRDLEIPPQLAALAASAKQRAELSEPEIIGRYRDLAQAMVARSILDSAGIECFLADDNLVRMDWLYSNLVGGIKLVVRHEDVEAAKKLLSQVTPEKFDLSGIGEYEQPKCPKCGSMDITFDELDMRVVASGMLAGVPLKLTKNGWSCHMCKHRWQEEDAAIRPSNQPE